LRALQLTERKSEYLIGIAQRMVDGRLSKQGLQALGSGMAAERELCRIRGIGPWSANYVLMRCLRWQDAFPIQDAGLHQAVQRRLGWDRKPTLAELEALSRGWEGWRAYAVFYLWQSLLS
jgi:DNA-3-methyladenine glycosylase II